MLVEFKDIRVKNLPPKYGDATLEFNGKNLDEWLVKGDKKKSKWVAGKASMSSDDPKKLVKVDGQGEMMNLAARHGDSLDFYSKEKFGDCRIELQVMVPRGSNSGIYVMGEYEIQVLDSWGKGTMGAGDMGAIYGAGAPLVNACLRPGQWQQYEIEFKAPRFDANGKKISHATFKKIELNGKLLHKKNLEMTKGVTGGPLVGREAPFGPIMFQGNHGPVAYRNIIVKRLVD
ncbi:MAG: DUF1080 domain-containing protein [Planctomycetes bacterium]|nr:DUF1080 domain-containing protein [Planctomycetota bacterium]